MGVGPSPYISVSQYLWVHANIIYGKLKLLPVQVSDMTFIDIEMMNKGFEDNCTEKRWERAYWTSIMVRPHLKKPVDPSDLMKPFLPEKTKDEIYKEKNHLMKVFGLEE